MKKTDPRLSYGLSFLCIAAAVCLYFAEIFIFKISFLSGDHRAQHFPWAFYYAEVLRSGQLPWWTTAFQAGFPLLAEGQVGALYPFNLLFYALFPVLKAYTFNILFHYAAGGCGMFLFLDRRGLSKPAALFGAFLFLFGVCQAGYYYNIISLKTLAWFPLVLLCLDEMFIRKKSAYAFLLGFLFSLFFLGGYLQYAVYAVGFSLVYGFWRIGENVFGSLPKPRPGRDLLLLGASLLLGVLLASPQLLATAELAGFSNRFSYGEEFAYIGSVNPLAAATFFFPHWDEFLGVNFYTGGLGLFFALYALTGLKKQRSLIFLILFVLAAALALGKYNPLYVWMIQLSKFYSFRTPAKFVFFMGFFLSILSAYGFDRWFRDGVTNALRKTVRVFSALFGTAVLGLLSANFILRIFRDPILETLRRYIHTHFAGSEIHPHPLEVYDQKLEGFYQAVLRVIQPSDSWNLLSIILLITTVLFLWKILLPARLGTTKTAVLLLVLLWTDLYAYGFTSIKGNLKGMDFVLPPSNLVRQIKQDHSFFRLARAPLSIAATDEFPVVPHTNMIHHFEMTGAYSPLLMKDYLALFSELGDVNDSQMTLVTKPEALERERTWIDFLNVKYLLIEGPVHLPGFEELQKENGFYLYQNGEVLPRAFFVTRGESMDFPRFMDLVRSGNFQPTRKVYGIGTGSAFNADQPEYFQPAEILRYTPEQVSLRVSAPSKGYLVLSDTDYPGWRAFVNGAETPIYRANGMFRAVTIPEAGEFSVKFLYDPPWKKFIGLTFGGWFLCLIFFFLMSRKGRSS